MSVIRKAEIKKLSQARLGNSMAGVEYKSLEAKLPKLPNWEPTQVSFKSNKGS